MRTSILSLIITISSSFAALHAANTEATATDQYPSQWAVKTNVLSDALLNVNLGVEFDVAPQYTIDFTSEINAWTLSHHRKWKHWYAQVEARRWLKQNFDGHFVAAHLYSGIYNLGSLSNGIKFLGTDYSKLGQYRYEGWMLGMGVAYGYSWHFHRYWSLEGELGLGYALTRYRTFSLNTWGRKLTDHQFHNYLGITKIAVNLVYNF
jgi:hypothetical protein